MKRLLELGGLFVIGSPLAPLTILLQSQFIRSIGLVFAANIVLSFADRADQPNHHSLSFSHIFGSNCQSVRLGLTLIKHYPELFKLCSKVDVLADLHGLVYYTRIFRKLL